MKLTEYWLLIQKGLVHTNSLTRKRALYLLKRTTDSVMIKSNKKSKTCNDEDLSRFDFRSDYYNEFTQENNSDSLISKVYLYEAASPLWNDFFLCIELMEETSVRISSFFLRSSIKNYETKIIKYSQLKVHIIKPCLPRALLLIDSVKAYKFHASWLLVLFERAFLHESKFIVRWAVRAFLQSDLHLLLSTNLSNTNENNNLSLELLNKFLFGPFVLILQKSYIYHK
jgi:hypothetical protein